MSPLSLHCCLISIALLDVQRLQIVLQSSSQVQLSNLPMVGKQNSLYYLAISNCHPPTHQGQRYNALSTRLLHADHGLLGLW